MRNGIVLLLLECQCVQLVTLVLKSNVQTNNVPISLVFLTILMLWWSVHCSSFEGVLDAEQGLQSKFSIWIFMWMLICWIVDS